MLPPYGRYYDPIPDERARERANGPRGRGPEPPPVLHQMFTAEGQAERDKKRRQEWVAEIIKEMEAMK